MPVPKKRNKNGTWSPIYGQAWTHPKTERACKTVQDAGHKPRYAPFLVLGWLHRLNIWCLANSTSGVVSALTDAKLAAVVWPEAFDDGIPPTRAGQLVRGALRQGGFLEDSLEGERVHEFRAFHARILSDRERHVEGDESDDAKGPRDGEDSAEGSAEDSAERSAEGSAEDSVEGSAAIGSDRIGSDLKIPHKPPTGGRKRRPPDPVVEALRDRIGCSPEWAASQVRALRTDGWSDQRIRDAIETHGAPGLAPWAWTERVIAASGSRPAPLTKPNGGLTAAGIAALATQPLTPLLPGSTP